MELVEKILKGDIASAAKLITMIENNREDAARIIKKIFYHTGNAYVIGVTGSPGVGKSSLVSSMISVFRKRGNTVGVIAVDSSSPFSGGALLGDRIRMQEHEADTEGIFMRSMATRGSLGGLSSATRDACYVMDAMGRDVIIIETVGVGQVELDIVNMAYTSIVVIAPGMGDSIQAIKAGIMEIGDIFVINKADHEGVDAALSDMEYMLHIGADKRDWYPEIFKTVATENRGIVELVEGIDRHRKYLEDNGLKSKKFYSMEQLIDLIKTRIEKRILDNRLGKDNIKKHINSIIKKEIDPYSVADMILDEAGL